MFFFLKALRVNLTLRDFSLWWIDDDHRFRAHYPQQKCLSDPLLAFRGSELSCLGFVAQETTLDEHGAPDRANQHCVILGIDATIGCDVRFIERLLNDLSNKLARGAL